MEGFQRYVAVYGHYLEEIRRRLYRVVVLFCCAFVVGFFSTTNIVRWLVAVFKMSDATIVATSPFQLVDLAVSTGYFVALLCTTPYIVHQIYAFLREGLLEKERKVFLVLLPLVVLLFAVGFSYGFAVMYYALGIIATVNVELGITNFWDIGQFISLIMLTSAFLGLLFEFPIVLTLLIREGVVPVQFLIEKRRHAYVVILILVILLPPTDGLSAIVMSAPLVLIYELTIFFNSFGRSVALST